MARRWNRWAVAALAGRLLLPAAASAQSGTPPPAADEPVRPPVLNRPLDAVLPPPSDAMPDFVYPPTPFDPPLGFTGRSSVLPRIKGDQDFIPVEDRWRIGFPAWDRADYNRTNPRTATTRINSACGMTRTTKTCSRVIIRSSASTRS